MKKEREEDGLNNLVNIGSCNLDVVHGTLKSATETTKCNPWGPAHQGVQIFRAGLPQKV